MNIGIEMDKNYTFNPDRNIVHLTKDWCQTQRLLYCILCLTLDLFIKYIVYTSNVS